MRPSIIDPKTTINGDQVHMLYTTRQICQICIPRRRVISEKHVNHKT